MKILNPILPLLQSATCSQVVVPMETVSRDAAVVLLSAVGFCCLTAGAGAGILTLALTQTAAHQSLAHVSGELSTGEHCREKCAVCG